MSKRRWTSEDIPDQTGRVAIVTGANSGIGYETAKALASRGATVIATSRSESRGSAAVERLRGEVPDAKVELMLLDLASLASVRAFAGEFLARFDRLDLLINNAGVMMPQRREETEDGFELQFGTNHLGHFALTLLLMDRLVGTSGSRVVNVSSSAQNFGGIDLDDPNWTVRPYQRMPSYAASKTANMLFTLELQRRFDEAGVSTIATAAHPGWTATNLQKSTPTFRILNPILAMKPWQGALPTLYAAVADVEPGGYYGPHGMANWRGYPAPNQPAEASTDAESARRLWDLSEELVQVTM
jgi:NAD(P)-dependent dehydrogenase (short-subunit alcohol dehydrogenase family)